MIFNTLSLRYIIWNQYLQINKCADDLHSCMHIYAQYSTNKLVTVAEAISLTCPEEYWSGRGNNITTYKRSFHWLIMPAKISCLWCSNHFIKQILQDKINKHMKEYEYDNENKCGESNKWSPAKTTATHVMSISLGISKWGHQFHVHKKL